MKTTSIIIKAGCEDIPFHSDANDDRPDLRGSSVNTLEQSQINRFLKTFRLPVYFSLIVFFQFNSRGLETISSPPEINSADSQVSQLYFAKELSTANNSFEIDPQSPATLGQGYDTFSSKLMGKAVEVGPLSSGILNKAEFTLELISSFSDLKKSLNISAQASFSGLWGGFDTSMQYANQSQSTSYRTYLMVKAKVYTKFEQLKVFEMADAPNRLLRRNKLADFYKAYGDEFIASITYGGELYGLIEFSSNSESQQSDLRASLSLSIAKFNASGNLQNAFSEINQQTSLSVKILRRGVDGGAFVVTPDELQKMAVNFPNAITNAPPTPILATTYNYATTERSHPGPVPDVNFARLALQTLAQGRDEVDTLKRDTEYVSANQAQFDIPDIQAVNDLNKWSRDSLLTIDNTALIINKDPFIDPVEKVKQILKDIDIDGHKRGLPKWEKKLVVKTGNVRTNLVFYGGWTKLKGDNDIYSKGGRNTYYAVSRSILQSDDTIVVTVSFRDREEQGDLTEFYGTKQWKFVHPGIGKISRVLTTMDSDKNAATIGGQIRSKVFPSGCHWAGDNTVVLDSGGDDQDDVGMSFDVSIDYEYKY
ncbi:MAG TPA: hypothetical protein VNN22_18150 [Verrucomicrobiae bacterium]|nr:hypothetical protein [Verrucomicrobiae bacterium]